MSEENSISISEIRNQWEEYPKPLDFEKLVEVSRHILEQVCDVEIVREKDEDVLYFGPNLNRKITVTNLSPQETLTAENINSEKNEINQIIKVILQMGVEQGLRIAEQWRADKGIESTIERAISIIKSEEDNNKVATTILESAIELLNSEQNVNFEDLKQGEENG